MRSILVSVLLGVASVAQAQGNRDVATATTPFYFAGGWVLLPPGSGWKVQRGPRGEDVLNFVRGDDYRHTWAASATTVLYDSASTREDLARLARARAEEGQGRRVTLRTFESTPDSMLAPGAIRYHYQVEDRKVPYDKGKLYVLDARGMVFTHPNAQRRLIMLEYSQRAEASIPLVEDSAADSFLVHANLVRPDAAKVRRLDVGDRPRVVRADGRAIWVACDRNLEGGSKRWFEILRLDPETMEIRARGRIDGVVPDFLVTADALWASDLSNERLVRLDPMSLVNTGSAKLGGLPWKLGVTPGTVWVTDPEDGRISTVDMATLKPARKPIRNIKKPDQVAVADGLVWISDAATNRVLSIDARTGAPVGAFIDVCNGRLVHGDSSLWIACPEDRCVQRLDPTTRTVSATIKLGFAPGALAFSRGALWVADYNAGRVVRIDAETNQVEPESTCAGLDVSGIAGDDRGIWVADAVAGTVAMMSVR